MPRYDFRTPRLFVEAALAAGRRARARPRAGAIICATCCGSSRATDVLVFNGRDGEWRARARGAGKTARDARRRRADARRRPPPADLHYLFAPLKHARLDYMVQKAVEMGASRLQPVLTQHTQVARVNLERMRANAIEAAEQCGILTLPEIAEPMPFDAMRRAARRRTALLVFCDEEAEVKDPVAALAAARGGGIAAPSPLAVLIGPEGGFAEEERAALLALPNVVRLALGPRILRADTAAVAALALVQAVLGDWR